MLKPECSTDSFLDSRQGNKLFKIPSLTLSFGFRTFPCFIHQRTSLLAGHCSSTRLQRNFADNVEIVPSLKLCLSAVGYHLLVGDLFLWVDTFDSECRIFTVFSSGIKQLWKTRRNIISECVRLSGSGRLVPPPCCPHSLCLTSFSGGFVSVSMFSLLSLSLSLISSSGRRFQWLRLDVGPPGSTNSTIFIHVRRYFDLSFQKFRR